MSEPEIRTCAFRGCGLTFIVTAGSRGRPKLYCATTCRRRAAADGKKRRSTK
jgi:hypothetical protein